MITPVMLMLSSISSDLSYTQPVNTMYLNQDDYDIIMSEVQRLTSILRNPSRVSPLLSEYTEEENNLYSSGAYVPEWRPSTEQMIHYEYKTIHPGTWVILNRLYHCSKLFEERNVSYVSFDTETILLNLESNPDYIYSYILKVMRSTNWDYPYKMSMFADLYSKIQMSIQDESSTIDGTVHRLKQMSELKFYQKLIYTDYLTAFGQFPPPITLSDLYVIRDELKELGLYGFCNPLELYNQFALSRVQRKTKVNISSDIVDLIRKILLSGGVTV